MLIKNHLEFVTLKFYLGMLRLKGSIGFHQQYMLLYGRREEVGIHCFRSKQKLKRMDDNFVQCNA